jgi:class 3 adenylate cyclase/DNA-binding SARP family transcriptional activator
MAVPDNANSRLHLRLFGPLEVRLNGVPARSGRRSRKGEWLLALLIFRHGRDVERAWLAGLLWPDRPTSEALALLRRELTDLRHALGPEGGRLHSPAARMLCLDLAGADVDLLAFDEAIERGAPEALAAAVRLYRGPLLEGCAEEWVFQERQVREQAYLSSLETLAAQALERGEPAEAEGWLRRAVAADPLRESAQRALMQVLAAGGNYAAVLQTYRQFREHLHQELNAEPDPETKALFEQLRQDARLRASLPPRPLTSSPHHLITSSPHPPPAAAIPEGENRLVTVLFADMCRYLETTRDLEPEDTAELVSRLLEAMAAAVRQHEGQIDRFQGDGVLAVFGVPQAHEEDAERAIRAAMSIRAAAHDLGLEVRVGVNTGTVYAGAVGSEQHQEVTVIGPAVSLAARLQEQAQPGEILVGEATYRQTRRAFEFIPRQIGVKGLPGPIAVYRVESARAHPEKSRGIEGLRAALIGREEELAKLQAALESVLQGKGQMVSLIGEAGVGKSRLVAELRQGVGGRVKGVGEETPEPTPFTLPPTPLWLEGCCVELGITASYGPFLDLLRGYFGWQPEDGEAARAARISTALRELVGQGDLSEAQLAEIEPLLGNLLSVRIGDERDERLQAATPQ